MSKSFEQAINILFASADINEKKSVLNQILISDPNLMESISIGCLKQSKMLVGGVGKCSAFLPLGIYIEGWFFPTNKYDSIEIYSGNKFIANANIGIQREDVYNNFSFFNVKNAGFNCFISEELETIEKNKTLVVIVKKKGKVIHKVTQKVTSYSVNDAIEDLENNLHENKNILIPILSNRIELVSAISKELPEYNFITLVEGMQKSIEETIYFCTDSKKMSLEDINGLFMLMVPDLLRRNNVPGYSEMPIKDRYLDDPKKNVEIWQASLNFQTKYNVSEEFSMMFCMECIKYAREIIRIAQPVMIMLWNKYIPWHQMLELVAEESGVPVVYMENGVLPGTLIFETGGQMGESYPSIHANEFCSLKVEEMDLVNANEIWDRLYKNKLNRWTSTDASVYKDEELDKVKNKLITEWPTILYAAQNDYESGFYPYTENTKKFHSPIFESSEEVAVYLGKLAEKNHWNLIYKRHPMMRGMLMEELPQNIIVNDSINIHDAIDISDLVITVLSQTSYVALIRHKPALMLGYHQLSHKGCIYETDEKEKIEEMIINALENGFTEEQRRNFNKHIAQLCKFYLYRDFTNIEINYGKSISDLKNYLIGVIGGNGCSVINQGKIACEVFYNEMEKNLVEPRFTLELSYLDRVRRKRLKKNMDNFEKTYNVIRESKNQKVFSDCMMFISQIDLAYLKKVRWTETFSKICEKYILEGQEVFENFLIWIDGLHEEIKLRLELNCVICETIKKMMQENNNYMKWAFSVSNVKTQKMFLTGLQMYIEEIKDFENRDITFMELIEKSNVGDLGRSYLFELIFKAGYFSKILMKEWMSLLLASNDENLLYYFGIMELDRIVFLYPQAIYDSYYIERNKLLKRISNLFNAHTCWKKSDKKSDKRLAMIVVGLHGKNFASTRLQIEIANELNKNDWNVTIYVADTNYISADNEFVVNPSTIRRNFSKEVYQRDHWIMADLGIEIKYFNFTESGKARYERLIKTIYEDNPSAIIDITSEQGIYNVQLIKDFPIITVPLNGYITSSVSSVYIGRNIKYVMEQEKHFGKIDTNYMFEANLYLPYLINKEKYNRAEYGFKENEFLFVTVGNRLDYEITEEIKIKMRDILNSNHGYRWIIVGKTDPAKFELLEKEIFSKQVVLWGYENSLYKLYRMCDVYLDLPRSGGGGSTALAVQSGIPAIVIDIYSDILPFLGEENAVTDFDASLEKLKELAESKTKRKQLQKAEFKNLMKDKWSLKNYVHVVENAINIAAREANNE